jgi:thiol:disulfide interchange protein
MLNFLVLILISTLSFAKEEHATISLQRWNNKLVATINHEKGWHTYWKNPGDAGIPESFKFYQRKKLVTPVEYEWPTPKRYLEAGDILTIGYEGVKHFFFDDIPGDISANIGILICKDICIPGGAELNLKPQESFVSNRPIRPYSPDELNQSFINLPQDSSTPTNFEFYVTRKANEKSLTLHYQLKNIAQKNLPHELPLLTAFPKIPWGFKRENLYFKDNTYFGKTEIEWDGEYQDPPLELPLNGEFKEPYQLKFLLNSPVDQKVQVIKIEVKNFSLASHTLDDFYSSLSTAHTEEKSKNIPADLYKFIFFAFLGGLILNLMPCVLPVISIKLFGLIKHQNLSPRKLFFHNLSYSIGVISSLMVLALLIAGLKATGEQIGWGFQLQSPAFILVMMLILFIFSLNLFGLFEFKTPGGSKIGNVQTEEGFAGDFFSGVLTTILSTPCSAPFLGTALTFAFTSSYEMIFLMFFFIGIGLSFPFLATAAFPKSLSILPKPGAWMEKLKYFLGLSLILTVIWLYDVFVSLVDFPLISWKLNTLFLFWFFGFFFLKKISGPKILQLIFLLIPFSLTLFAIQNLPLKPNSENLSQTSQSNWSPWSEKALADLKGKTVFMDFTAEWCLTCKVNKKLVLETKSFKELAQKNNLVLLRGDWTRRDDSITKFLLQNDTVGVPAYFIQKPDGTLIRLGETISVSKIEENLL